MEAWGGALADFCFFGPEMDTNAVRMEPFGSCALEVLLWFFPGFFLVFDYQSCQG
jgi:hypothetical protein